MLSEVRPSELGAWAALYRIDPWGEERGDLQSGIVASTIANVHRAKGVAAFSPADFMPFREKQSSTAKQLREFLKSRPTKKAR